MSNRLQVARSEFLVSFCAIRNPNSLAQTGYIVNAVYLVLVCKKGSHAILKSAPGRAKIRNVWILTSVSFIL